MMLGFILFFVIIISIFHVIDLVTKKWWKELVVYLMLLSLAILYSIGQIYHWSLPNPTTKMQYMMESIWNILE